MCLSDKFLEKTNYCDKLGISIDDIRSKYPIDYLKGIFKTYNYQIPEKRLELIYEETLKDLKILAEDNLQNINRLLYRLNRFSNELEDHISEMRKRKLHITKSIIEDQKKDIILAGKKIKFFKNKLLDLIFNNKQVDNRSAYEFETGLYDFLAIYRYLLSYLASVTTRLEWQSVSFESSKRAEIFQRDEFEYKGYLGYKRVNYPDLVQFEKWFLEEFIDNPNKEDLVCLLTNSGQGAFITLKEMICNLLLSPNDKIIQSKYGYYETRWLINETKGFEILYYNGHTADEIISQIYNEKPKLIILEPYYCDERIRLLDINKVLLGLSNLELENEIHVIIDSSILSGAIQPFSLGIENKKVNLYLMESFIKYRQYGQDKVNAGFIISHKKYLGKLIAIRAATGAILHNIDLETLSRISREQHDLRMKLITRNARYIANELQKFAEEEKYLKFKGVEYPGLETHCNYHIASVYPYLNGIINFVLDKDYYHNLASMLYVIRKVIDFAKKKNSSINHGTSFGFDWTRLAVADSTGGDFSVAFIRMSVGREIMKDIVITTEVIKEAIGKYLRY